MQDILTGLDRKYHRSLTICPDAVDALQRYTWPGNVRELRNVVEYSAFLCEDDTITAAALPDSVRRTLADEQKETLAERVYAFEQAEIRTMLYRYGNTLEGKRKATAALGIFLASLYNKLKCCPLSRIDGQKNIRYNGKERGQRKWKTNAKKG